MKNSEFKGPDTIPISVLKNLCSELLPIISKRSTNALASLTSRCLSVFSRDFNMLKGFFNKVLVEFLGNRNHVLTCNTAFATPVPNKHVKTWIVLCIFLDIQGAYKPLVQTLESYKISCNLVKNLHICLTFEQR